MIVCPQCKLKSRDTAAHCDCGHVFKPEVASEARAPSDEPPSARPFVGTRPWSLYSKVLISFGAAVMLSAPVISSAANMSGWRGVAVIVGVGGLTLLKGVLSR